MEDANFPSGFRRSNTRPAMSYVLVAKTAEGTPNADALSLLDTKVQGIHEYQVYIDILYTTTVYTSVNM